MRLSAAPESPYSRLIIVAERRRLSFGSAGLSFCVRIEGKHFCFKFITSTVCYAFENRLDYFDL